MKQQTLERRLSKLNLKFTKAKAELTAAKRRAASTRLAARAARQTQRLAKKKAHATRDAARTAESALSSAARAFSKVSARLKKLRKKAMKDARGLKTAGRTKTPQRKRGVAQASAIPVSPANTSRPAMAKAAALMAKRTALQRLPHPASVGALPSIVTQGSVARAATGA